MSKLTTLDMWEFHLFPCTSFPQQDYLCFWKLHSYFTKRVWAPVHKLFPVFSINNILYMSLSNCVNVHADSFLDTTLLHWSSAYVLFRKTLLMALQRDFADFCSHHNRALVVHTALAPAECVNMVFRHNLGLHLFLAVRVTPFVFLKGIVIFLWTWTLCLGPLLSHWVFIVFSCAPLESV